LTDAEIKAGNLHDRFDIIILPDQNPLSIINGHGKGTTPPGYVGGITREGVDHLKTFVGEGGTLLCNKSSASLAINEFNLPVRDVLEDVKSDAFNCPGSILKVTYKTDHPLAFGMEKEGAGYFSRGQAYESVSDGEEKNQNDRSGISIQKIACYPDESLLLSGWIIGEESIRGKTAILEVSYVKGKMLLFGFSFHNRAQSYGNFKLLFNAIFN
jgi:hypothetical protein